MHIAHKINPILLTYKVKSTPHEVTASYRYLGIGINNDLSWAEHISSMVSKANKVPGLLCQNLYSCSPFVRETAYMSLARQKLEYCSSIWIPTTSKIKISLNQFNVELQDLSVRTSDAKAISLTC